MVIFGARAFQKQHAISDFEAKVQNRTASCLKTSSEVFRKLGAKWPDLKKGDFKKEKWSFLAKNEAQTRRQTSKSSFGAEICQASAGLKIWALIWGL